MEVVEIPVLGCCLDMPEALGLFVVILRLVDDFEPGIFHRHEVFPTEFPVVAHLADFEAPPPHVDEPVDHIGVIDRRGVAQRQPSIIRPAEQRTLILIRLNMGRHHRENAWVMIISTSL